MLIAGGESDLDSLDPASLARDLRIAPLNNCPGPPAALI
jgi:hypothetical protein